MEIKSKVMVISGTADGRQIIEELSKLNIPVTATVTTGFGKELLSGLKGVAVVEGKLTPEGMVQLIRDTGAKCLVDATHPYAREASVNAISASEKAGVPYLRFERMDTELAGDRIITVKDFKEAAKTAASMDGNIFLATGSNTVEIFTNEISDYKNRLFARVLPDSRVVLKCEQAGLSANNILAMKGPFSENMNIEMLKHCKAAVMVTKDSGETGGTEDKLQAAQKLGITVILVQRPVVDYPEKVSSRTEVLEFVKKYAD